MTWLASWQEWLRNGIDIFLIAIIVYRILIMMRGSRAAQALLGLILILIAYIASEAFELATLSWVMHHVVNHLFIILIVLFQSEIRRALAQMGRRPFWTNHHLSDTAKFIEEIVRATAALASNREGALIVVTKQSVLGAIVETGVKLDAKISQELLQSIFRHHSPLHDGAVIIDGDRVVAAACVLPLAVEGKLHSAYGTRHRAALGLSQESDALIIVVSEERGTISIAVQGELTSGLSPETLRAHLQKHFYLPAKADEG